MGLVSSNRWKGKKGMGDLNPNPTVYESTVRQRRVEVDYDDDDTEREPIDAQEVFDLIRHINDPEHPLTLEQLNVVQLPLIHVDDSASRVHVRFAPTIPHCSMATLIGLSIRVRLLRSLPRESRSTSKSPQGHTHRNTRSTSSSTTRSVSRLPSRTKPSSTSSTKAPQT